MIIFRFDYGLKLVLLSIDEGISGYRDDSLETVKRNRDQYGIPLKILSYQDLYGWTMDKIVETVGRKNNCTFCGVFRRQALDRGAMQLGEHSGLFCLFLCIEKLPLSSKLGLKHFFLQHFFA